MTAARFDLKCCTNCCAKAGRGFLNKPNALSLHEQNRGTARQSSYYGKRGINIVSTVGNERRRVSEKSFMRAHGKQVIGLNLHHYGQYLFVHLFFMDFSNSTCRKFRILGELYTL
ncbi:hypothetical protein [Paenibacillus konkukensis]|uniref:hypothetical protein n=1 Tax=Paenibacillus konkukensis TaxID=2020716 RepID=UPI00201D9013|nr:hypothetical protein [Paenibacillus konkukensis]